MDFRASALDIEELVTAFAVAEGTELEQMKDLWRIRNFSFIWEARPKDVTAAFYAQALFSCALSHMVAEEVSICWNLGGLYVLYILYETQDKEDSYKIYLSLEELESLVNLVRKIKLKGNLVAFKVVKRMFAEQMFLFGSVSANQKRIASCMAKVAHQAALSVQQARSRLLSHVPVREHLEGQLVKDLKLDELTQLRNEYAVTKRQALCLSGNSSESRGDTFDDDSNVVSEVVKEAQSLDHHKSQMLRSALESRKKRSLSTNPKKPASVKQIQVSKGGKRTIDDFERELVEQVGDATSEHERELEEELNRALDLD
ncbi:hypothetical protein R1flu_021903 [Riccia fluitans]|uniref:snRNA-activating protein complex subunit 1 n=1 Tax=Riccia fluitans TaxID=41844 RepID=A0ABD1ZQP3_9MARC